MSSISRIAKAPIQIPAGVTVVVDGQLITVKGPKGAVSKKVLTNGVTLHLPS